MRAAATSLTQGVLTALQVIGLLREGLEIVPPQMPNGQDRMPAYGSSCGVEIGDLLDWQRKGESLASIVARRWQAFEPGGRPRGHPSPSLICLLQAKAEQTDLKAVHGVVRLWSSGPPPIGGIG